MLAPFLTCGARQGRPESATVRFVRGSQTASPYIQALLARWPADDSPRGFDPLQSHAGQQNTGMPEGKFAS